MSRNNISIKPIKDRKVSAVSLYIPPEVKKFWYDCYEQLYNDKKDKPSISEFLSGMLNDRLKQLNISDNGLLTLEVSGADLKEWDELRLNESVDPADPVPWGEFIIEKVNAGINLLDEIRHAGPDTGDYEKKIDHLKETNTRLMRQVADLKQEIKVKDITAGRNLIRDAILEVLSNSDKQVSFIDLANAVDNQDVLYNELMRLFDDDVIEVETKGKSDYYRYKA